MHHIGDSGSRSRGRKRSADRAEHRPRNETPRDAWGGGGSESEDEYSPDRFFTRAVDSNGHAVWSARLRVNPETMHALSALVQSGVIPEYRTVSDIFRDSLVHRLRYLTDHVIDPEAKLRLSEASRILMLNETVKEFTDQHDIYERFEMEFRQAAHAGLKGGDAEGIERLCERTLSRAEELREPFRGRLYAAVKDIREQVAKVRNLSDVLRLDEGS